MRSPRQPGEHPYCGRSYDGGTGQTYGFEQFYKVGVKVVNMSWVDMGVPSFKRMVEITSVVCRETRSGGKVMVHCHAGHGRTGVVIACCMLVEGGGEGGRVVDYVRAKR